MSKKTVFFICAIMACFFPGMFSSQAQDAPRIVNIINFIRQTEPRIDEITDDILYQTVVKQVQQLNQYKMKGTFLLQYDALINPKYQQLLKEELYPGSEVGGWWEITQPHVEAAGIKWRGRYPWDWHADVGFSTGYTPREREKLVDVFMEKFKAVFGTYPASVGSWFIDEHTLGYMYDKYKITASCNCKDQIGTDGYTLWGGYWSQAYYPSRKNAYMPAQNKKNQIPVPVFRMLGSDPSYQYDCGIGSNVWQDVITIEPAANVGSDKQWVEWLLGAMFEDPGLNFTYVQIGQENSFTWDRMAKGLEMQIPLLAAYETAKKIRIETLEESGKWFKKKFPVTPPTAISSLSDYRELDRKTVWYNSRYYRTNLLWEGQTFKIRDIHLFNETFESEYLDKPLTSSKCTYFTLPLVDGNLWSSGDKMAGMRLRYAIGDGKMKEATGHAVPVITQKGKTLQVEWALDEQAATLQLLFKEECTEISCHSDTKGFRWELELSVAPHAELPFTKLDATKISGVLNDFPYTVTFPKGEVHDNRQTGDGHIFTITPTDQKVILSYKNNSSKN